MTNTDYPAARSPAESVAAFTAHLDAIDRVADPVAWATAAYRLGMATAEQPTAQPEVALREALGLYEQAAQVLTERRAPAEHARILNAAGSAHRLLGDHATAAGLFERSLRLLDGRGAEAEEASVLTNLGLVLAEQGRIDDAIAIFERSLVALVADTDAAFGTPAVAEAAVVSEVQAVTLESPVANEEQVIRALVAPGSPRCTTSLRPTSAGGQPTASGPPSTSSKRPPRPHETSTCRCKPA